MVKIIDGEIVQDDDPRVTQSRQPRAQPSHPHGPSPPQPHGSRAPPIGGSGFDVNAPPFRVVSGASEQRILGIPDFEVFGVRFTAAAVGLMLAGFMFMQWRGLLAAAVLWFIYQANMRTGPAAAQQRAAAGRPQAPVPGVQQQGVAPQQPEPARTQAAGQQPATGSFTGRSYKLSG